MPTRFHHGTGEVENEDAMNKSEYEGIYHIKRSPIRMKNHNAESWEKIEKLMSKNGGKADFDALTVAVKDHRSGTQSANYPYQFITYCIRSGWLQRYS